MRSLYHIVVAPEKIKMSKINSFNIVVEVNHYACRCHGSLLGVLQVNRNFKRAFSLPDT